VLVSIDAVLIGAGGFGREVLDVVEAHNEVHRSEAYEHIHLLGIVDDAPSQVNLSRLNDRGYAHLGGIKDLLDRNHAHHFILGVGNPKIKRRIAERLEGTGLRPLTIVHPSAVIGSVREIGPGSIICGGVQ
jgi:homoserine dehydrogenase